jgi:membrane-associated PAP2 superfamily phosphatase
VLVLWLATFFSERLRPWRRRAGFAFLAVALSTGIVGGLKVITNVDCPWDLREFGGERPYVTLFADRPDSLPHAACFPGAHASAGFALMFGYFVLLGRSRRQANWALSGAIVVGLIFSIGQEARGAHFLSHDLTAAAIVWFTQLFLYVRILAPADCAERLPSLTGLQGESAGTTFHRPESDAAGPQ